MATRRLGIVMYGVTGRMGLNQHLVRSIVAIRDQGGVALPGGDRIMPDPILVGRNAEKVGALAKQYGFERSTADLDAALSDPRDEVFFDAATTQMRADLLTRAIQAGKHVYCEKPVAPTAAQALTLLRQVERRVEIGRPICDLVVARDCGQAPGIAPDEQQTRQQTVLLQREPAFGDDRS